MAWSFSGLFRQRTVKETFDPTPIAVGIVPPSLTDTLWALRRTEDMVELMLSFSGGKLVCHPVRIGADVTIGANAIVMPGSTVGERAVVVSGSVVMPGTSIPAGETWRGNPARKWL